MSDVFRAPATPSARASLEHLPAPAPGAWNVTAMVPAHVAGMVAFSGVLLGHELLRPGPDLTAVGVALAALLVTVAGAAGGLGARVAGLADPWTAGRHGAVAGLVLAGWCLYPLLPLVIVREPFGPGLPAAALAGDAWSGWVANRSLAATWCSILASGVAVVMAVAGACGAIALRRVDAGDVDDGWVGPDASLVGWLACWGASGVSAILAELAFGTLRETMTGQWGPRASVLLRVQGVVVLAPWLCVGVALCGRLRVSGGHAWCERGMAALAVVCTALGAAGFVVQDPWSYGGPVLIAALAVPAQLRRERRREASPVGARAWTGRLFWLTVVCAAAGAFGQVFAYSAGLWFGLVPWVDVETGGQARSRPAWDAAAAGLLTETRVVLVFLGAAMVLGLAHLILDRLRVRTRRRLADAWSAARDDAA